MPRTNHLAVLLLIIFVFSACVGASSTRSTPPVEVVVPPNSALEPPPPVAREGLLQGATAAIPEVWIVPSLQPKAALAAYLKTTVEQFDRVNPGLDDLVAPGTLVAIPTDYRVSSGETLSSIVAVTGVTEELLRGVNPKLAASGTMPEGTVLAMPPIVIWVDATSVEATAAALNLSSTALLSANPELAAAETITAGTVLVLPAGEEGQFHRRRARQVQQARQHQV